MTEDGYQELNHTADIAIRVQGEDLGDILRNAASGMLDLMEFPPGEPSGEVLQLEIDALDEEDLLVAWLQEILYVLETRGIGLGRMEIHVLDEWRLKAQLEALGEMKPSKEIKAVTYHGLEIKEIDGKLEATVVFDV
ncbi:MAG: archease [Anaerolineales bacterium]|nr:archease [Anaerolineales bacterium]